MKSLISGSLLIFIGRTANRLYLLPSNAALFLKGLYTVWPAACMASSGIRAADRIMVFALDWSAWFLFLRSSCMSNGTSDGQALEVHLDNPSVCDGLVWLGTYSSAPSSPVNDDAYYDSSRRDLIFLGGRWYELCQDGAPGVAGSAGSAGAAGNVWSSGTGAAAGGNNGDFYYNTSTYHVWEKITGTWTDLGLIQGGTGASGSAGAAGNVWSSGTGAAAGGNNGDFYYNTSTYHVWEKITGTSTDLGSIQGGTGASGSAGAAGTVWSSGTGAAAGGNNGDFYYNTSTYHVWEKDNRDADGSRVNPGWNRGSGSAGAAGNVWSSGTGAAAGGNNGDSITTHRLIMSGKKITGTRTDLGSIQGGTGASGSAGAAGNVWSSGTGAAAGGNNGDFYYNTSTYHVWEKITGIWNRISGQSRVEQGLPDLRWHTVFIHQFLLSVL